MIMIFSNIKIRFRYGRLDKSQDHPFILPFLSHESKDKIYLTDFIIVVYSYVSNVNAVYLEYEYFFI